MSRGYRVTWATATGSVTSGDTLSIKLSLLGILSDGEMCALLRDELSKDGWTREPDGTMVLKVEGATARVPPDGSEVVVTLESERRVQTEAPDKQQAEAALTAAKAQAAEQIKAEASRKLLTLEPSLRQRVNEAVQRVYVESLRKKAAAMGEIESVQEARDADGAIEVTIKVRV